jgi:plastocyanin
MFKFVAASLLFFSASSQAVDIPIAWTVTTYEDIIAQSGDTITFTWDGTHNAYIHPSGSCDGTGAIEVGGTSPATYTFTDADVGTSMFFACEVGTHCDLGQHITVSVQGAVVGATEPPATSACNVCGDGNMVTTPDVVVTIPTQADRTCAEYEAASSAGAIDTTQCQQLQPFTSAACGCAPMDGVIATAPPEPDVNPSPNATEAPSTCNICGDGNMVTTPDVVVSVPTQDDRTCSEYEAAASAGAVNATQCQQLQPFTSAACGCSPMDGVIATDTPEPDVTSSPNATDAPVDDGAAPTAAPVVAEPEATPAPVAAATEPPAAPDSAAAAYIDRFALIATIVMFGGSFLV